MSLGVGLGLGVGVRVEVRPRVATIHSTGKAKPVLSMIVSILLFSREIKSKA